jgi:hypothetical protein
VNSVMEEKHVYASATEGLVQISMILGEEERWTTEYLCVPGRGNLNSMQQYKIYIQIDCIKSRFILFTY